MPKHSVSVTLPSTNVPTNGEFNVIYRTGIVSTEGEIPKIMLRGIFCAHKPYFLMLGHKWCTRQSQSIHLQCDTTDIMNQGKWQLYMYIVLTRLLHTKHIIIEIKILLNYYSLMWAVIINCKLICLTLAPHTVEIEGIKDAVKFAQ